MFWPAKIGTVSTITSSKSLDQAYPKVAPGGRADNGVPAPSGPKSAVLMETTLPHHDWIVFKPRFPF